MEFFYHKKIEKNSNTFFLILSAPNEAVVAPVIYSPVSIRCVQPIFQICLEMSCVLTEKTKTGYFWHGNKVKVDLSTLVCLL